MTEQTGVTSTPTGDDIRAAAEIVSGALIETPAFHALGLSDLTGTEIFVKCENLHRTSSFKERGALVKLSGLSEEERSKGVIAMSAGNHAQAVAYHAKRLGIKATIVMPEFTPFVKVAATAAHGAEIELFGATLYEAGDRVAEIVAETGAILVHPYDDFEVIRGQGTCGLEFMRQVPDLDTLVVPIGGGGLISGVSVAARGANPDIEIIGVQTDLFPAMYNVISGENRPLGGETLAEGIAVKGPGRITREIIRQNVDDILLVTERYVEEAINAFLSKQRLAVEGAGAAGLAALLQYPERFREKRVGLVVCGGNIDPRMLSSIAMRQLVRNGQVVAIQVRIADQPGTLGRIASVVGNARANILEVVHRRHDLDLTAKGAFVDLQIETRDHKHSDDVMARLREAGFEVTRSGLPDS